jgi:predicted SAM-dependent methyltransferase
VPEFLLDLRRRWHQRSTERAFQAAAPAAIEAYLRSPAPHRLQLACGPYPIDGWLNVDSSKQVASVVFVDCLRPMPFPDASFDCVFSEHFIEHLLFDDGARLLEEVHRVLQPGGRIRIATPDIRFLIGLYGSPKSETQSRYLCWAVERWPGVKKPKDVFVINHFFRAWGHRFIYDPATLSEVMESVGFSEITLCSPGQSAHPPFQGIERHGMGFSEEFNALETFVLEARRG